jgi:hypothetical protein
MLRFVQRLLDPAEISVVALHQTKCAASQLFTLPVCKQQHAERVCTIFSRWKFFRTEYFAIRGFSIQIARRRKSAYDRCRVWTETFCLFATTAMFVNYEFRSSWGERITTEGWFACQDTATSSIKLCIPERFSTKSESKRVRQLNCKF